MRIGKSRTTTLIFKCHDKYHLIDFILLCIVVFLKPSSIAMNKEVKITLLFWLVSSLLIGEIISGYYYYHYQATMNEFSEAIALGKLMPELVGGEDKLQYIDKFFTLLDFPQWYFDYLKLTGYFFDFSIHFRINECYFTLFRTPEKSYYLYRQLFFSDYCSVILNVY